jgi:DHA2 family multidrug resistance protein-like MFS transporter
MRMSPHRTIGTAAVLLAMALVVLDAGITNVALPTISGSLSVPPAKVIQVTSAYQLALLMGLLPAAHIASRTGSRKLFVLGLWTFTGASLIAAISPTFSALVAARFAQGLGGAAILALGIPLLRSALGRDRLGSAIAWNALNVAVCAATGPAIGAFLIAIASWPWLFLVNLPVGALALAASRALPAGGGRSTAIDLHSIVLHAAGAALLFLAFESLVVAPINAAILTAFAAVSFALLVRRELRKEAPLLPLDLMRHRPFRLAVGASILCFVAQSSGQLALPFYLQQNLGAGALATGAVMACWPVAVALTSRVANLLAERISAGLLCAAGGLFLCGGLFLMAVLQPALGLLVLCAAICGVGFGLFQVPNNRNLFFTASEHRSEAAGGMQGTARLAGQLCGSVLVSLVFTSIGPGASQCAFTLGAVFAFGAGVVSLRQVTGAERERGPDAIQDGRTRGKVYLGLDLGTHSKGGNVQ